MMWLGQEGICIFKMFKQASRVALDTGQNAEGIGYAEPKHFENKFCRASISGNA